MEAKLKHLEMIQGVINRMAANSFQLKGWSVTLLSALLALAAGSGRPVFAFLALIPCAAFWLLDGFFLRQERLFRALYNDVAYRDAGIAFSMDTRPYLDRTGSWLKVCFSSTLRLFHGALLFGLIAASFAIACVAGD
jgi:hypothetical protein